MPLLIPPAANYPSPLVAIPSTMQDEPREGRKQIPIEIGWGMTAAILANKCVDVNFQANTSLEISQISSLKVDNSNCAADVVFIFPDTSETVTVPAGAPYVLVPVFSNSKQFFVSSPSSRATDTTRIQAINYLTHPADIPQSQMAQVANSGGNIVSGGTTVIQLIPATISGTLESLQMSMSTATALAAAQQFICSALDGTGVLGFSPGVLVDQWNIGFPVGFAGPLTEIFDFPDLNWRFTNGLKVQITGAFAQAMICNTFASYRIP